MLYNNLSANVNQTAVLVRRVICAKVVAVVICERFSGFETDWQVEILEDVDHGKGL
ncbi:MAG: hypothetical protein QHI38_10930 [Armatimonadota bacterium]|nr:hypothetical protein [Armatimonadota bacterium]